jgi:hypothetical protein
MAPAAEIVIDLSGESAASAALYLPTRPRLLGRA